MKHDKNIKEIIKVIALLSPDTNLLGEFFTDLLTPAEYREITIRWQIVKQLNKGISQRKIAENLGISVATVSRGARVMLGPKGGFHRALTLIRANKKGVDKNT